MLAGRTGRDNVVVRGARILDPVEGVDAILDVRVDDGVIAQIGERVDTNSHLLVEAEGRVLVPAYLRESIDLGSESVVVGSRDHAEIWAPKAWDEYRQALDDPQQLARAFEGLGI